VIPPSILFGKQLEAEQYSTNEIHQDVEGHNPEDKVGGVGITTPGDFQHNWKTSQTVHQTDQTGSYRSDYFQASSRGEARCHSYQGSTPLQYLR
jgi:hypothetical protein